MISSTRVKNNPEIEAVIENDDNGELTTLYLIQARGRR
jgi:hypothetical protein